jgi:LPXTG-site transpeptidase (sortase) family protein
MGFDLKNLKRKRPLWRDMLSFALLVTGVWGASHIGLNYGAYSQIYAFKYENLKASVIEDIDHMKTKQKLDEFVKKSDGHLPVVKPVEKLAKIVRKNKVTFRKKNLKSRNQAKELFKNIPVYPSDNRLVIPRIGKNVPLLQVPNHKNWKELEKKIQKGLQNGVVVHPVSGMPGDFGNLFLTGHSSYYKWDPGRYKDVFALLHEVIPGDIVYVYWEGRRYTYRISEKKVVPPTAVGVLSQPKDKKILTLMTCTPVGTNKNRLILVGELKE